MKEHEAGLGKARKVAAAAEEAREAAEARVGKVRQQQEAAAAKWAAEDARNKARCIMQGLLLCAGASHGLCLVSVCSQWRSRRLQSQGDSAIGRGVSHKASSFLTHVIILAN